MTREEIEKYFVESTGFGIDKIKSFMMIVDKALEEKGEQIKRLKADNEKLKKEIIEIEKVSDFRWEENEQLKAQIEKMKNCQNCNKYRVFKEFNTISSNCIDCKNKSNWELAE